MRKRSIPIVCFQAVQIILNKPIHTHAKKLPVNRRKTLTKTYRGGNNFTDNIINSYNNGKDKRRRRRTSWESSRNNEVSNESQMAGVRGTSEDESRSNSDSSMPFLFMSDNEEEEKIIQALSMPVEDDVDEGYDYYTYDDDIYNMYEEYEEKDLFEQAIYQKSQKDTNTGSFSKHQSVEKMKENGMSQQNDQDEHKTQKKIKSKTNKNDNNKLEASSEIMNKMKTKGADGKPLNNSDLIGINSGSSFHSNKVATKTSSLERKIESNSKGTPEDRKNIQTAPPFDPSLNLSHIQKMNIQQKENLPSYTNRPKIPIEIPSSIDAIRLRAASNSRNRAKVSPLSRLSLFTQQQQQHQQQQIESNNDDFSSPKTHNVNPTSNSPTNGKQQQQQQVLSTKAKKANRKLPTTMSLTTPWARKFILSRPKDALLPIPREFLTDGFNLVQLAPIVEQVALVTAEENTNNKKEETKSLSPSSYPSLYKAALRLILDDSDNNVTTTKTTGNSVQQNPTQINNRSHHSPELIQKAAEVLYTLVHARYVTSPRGLDTIRRMFLRNYEIGTDEVFGKCPRIKCAGAPLLPFGMSCRYDFDGKDGINRKSMRYCSCCGEVRLLYSVSL